MSDHCRNSRENRTSSLSRRARQQRLAPFVIGGAALVLAAGCSSSGSSAASSGGSSGGQTAQQAITAATQSSRQLTSVSAKLTEKTSGGTSLSGTFTEQLRPTLQMDMKLNSAVSGQPTTIDGIIAGKAMYLKMAILQKELGKPWLKISLSSMKLGKSSFSSLFQSLTKQNPLTQTAMFTAAKDARVVGTQTIDGVSTTEYAGTITPGEAVKNLPASTRKELGSTLKAIQGTVRFKVWIDGQHQLRQIQETEHIDGQTIVTTVLITGMNQAVHITAPPASEVAKLPAGLSGL
ncbi:MAG: hypothetical protein ACLQDY_12985 [Streptosporangiaceae bacterium]